MKYLRKNGEADDTHNSSANDNSRKRSIDSSNISEENDHQTPKAKKKVILGIENIVIGRIWTVKWGLSRLPT